MGRGAGRIPRPETTSGAAGVPLADLRTAGDSPLLIDPFVEFALVGDESAAELEDEWKLSPVAFVPQRSQGHVGEVADLLEGK